jgi:hypothetical protein
VRFQKCFKELSTFGEFDLLNISDKFWQGLFECGRMNGTGAELEYWGKLNKLFVVHNPKALPATFDGILIMEPCNTISNFAYCYTMAEVCERDKSWFRHWSIDKSSVQALAVTLNPIVWSSSFLHASETGLGFAMDNKSIQILLYAIYQAAIAPLPYDVVLHEISNTPLNSTAVEGSNAFLRTLNEESVLDWRSLLKEIDVPSTATVLAVNGGLAFYLTLPQAIAQSVYKTFYKLLRDGVGRTQFCF